MSGHATGLALFTALAVALCGAAGAAEQPPLGGDWDWGGYTALPDAPVARPGGGRQATAAKPVPPRRIAEPAPDLDAAPRRGYALFPDVPPFQVIPAKRDSEMHPCSNCHQWTLSNRNPRDLQEPHDGFKLEHGLHGKGKFWCFTCHDLEGSGGLRTLEGEKLEFGDAYVLCSQCHASQARDWVYGAHGKRVSGWGERRQVLNCTACHYQHRPALKARAPQPGPEVRMALQRPQHWVSKDRGRAEVHGYQVIWQQAEAEPGHRAAGGRDE